MDQKKLSSQNIQAKHRKASCCTRNNVTKSLADPQTYHKFDQIDRCRTDSTQLQKAQKNHPSVRFVITQDSGDTENELWYKNKFSNPGGTDTLV